MPKITIKTLIIEGRLIFKDNIFLSFFLHSCCACELIYLFVVDEIYHNDSRFLRIFPGRNHMQKFLFLLSLLLPVFLEVWCEYLCT